MCRDIEGLSFACSVSEVSRRTHKLFISIHGGILETLEYRHLTQPQGSWPKLAHPCNCRHVRNLVHRVRLQK